MHRHHITLTALTTIALALAAGPAAAKKKSEKPARAEQPAAKETTATTDDGALWFEAPLAVPAKKSAKAPPAKKTEKTEAPRYGLSLRLGNARNGREAPRVEERAVDMTPALSQADVRRVMRGQHRAIGFCGRRAARGGETATQVLLHFRVDSAGNADRVRVTELSGKPMPAMSRCMGHAAKRWQFPANTAGGEIDYPLMLNRR